MLGRPLEDLALVALHLGNGCSAAAVLGGRSVDTSMGLSPLEGLVMGTRSGDLDPAVVFHLHREAGLSIDEVEQVLTKQSGLKGLAGDNDLRAVEARAADGDADAQLALDVDLLPHPQVRRRVRRGDGPARRGRADRWHRRELGVRARARAGGLELLGVAVDAVRNVAPTARRPPDLAGRRPRPRAGDPDERGDGDRAPDARGRPRVNRPGSGVVNLTSGHRRTGAAPCGRIGES